MVTSLERAYGSLLRSIGLGEFTVEEAAGILGAEGINVLLHRLRAKGYIERVSRGVFRLVHPTALALSWSGIDWREGVRQREYLPLLEAVVSRLIESLGSGLRSIILFGSLARGEASETSDIDLLIVSEGLPERYSDRVRLLRGILGGLEEVRLRLWRERGLYPLIDALMLTPEEASINHPFYLDLLEEAVIILDRDDFMKRRMMELRGRLREMGARRIRLPGGAWYWELKPDLKPGEVVEL